MNALWVLGVGIFFLPFNTVQANDQEAHFGAVGELGVRYHTGQLGKSFTEALGPFLFFQGGARRGLLRPSLGVAFEFITGNATISSGNVSGTGYSGGIYPGLEIFPFGATKIQPFLEVHAIASWNYVALSPVVPVTEEKSLSLGFGGQVGLGFDFKYHGAQRALRIHASYSSYSAKIAGQTGFQLNAYALSFGMGI